MDFSLIYHTTSKMNFFYICVLSLIMTTVSSNSCHACFDGICYANTPIIDKYKFSGQLAIDRAENIVYFHYEDSKSIDHTAAFDLTNIRSKSIPNIDFSFARTVDQTTRDVYIGGASGIYKYNPISNVTALFGLIDKTIWHMQFKNKIYYTIFKTKGLFTFENRQQRSISPLSNYTIDDFIIDYRENIYFLSQSKVYRLKNGESGATLFANDIYSLSLDKEEIAHFFQSGKRGLYKLDEKNDNLIEIGAFGSGFPVKSVFDNENNIIYHENHSRKLIYLMPTYGRCAISYRMRGTKISQKKNFYKLTGNSQNGSLFLEVRRIYSKNNTILPT